MSSGTSTGTPAVAAGSATLTSLRARVLQQVTAADSGKDPTVITASALTLPTFRDRVATVIQSIESDLIEGEVMSASAETLASLRGRVETTLQDSDNAIWETTDVDEALEQALERYNRVSPDHAIGTVTFASATREISISALTGLTRVEKVWTPYNVSAPTYPPGWVDFRVWPGSILYIDSSDTPQTNEVARVFYTKAHTLSGLNAAGATTIPVDDVNFIISGAAALCANFRAIEQAEQANVDDKVFERLQKWADKMMDEFNVGLKMRERRRRQDYDQDELDEAIRQALEQYSRRKPDHAISTLTLAADGREVDASSLTTAVRIERIWWDYDNTLPGHPPNWRQFTIWPGKIIYVNDPSEPQSGDKVRVQYTKVHTINGLDSAAATTFPVDDEAFLVMGAAHFAARFRAARSGSVQLLNWAKDARKDFNRGLFARDQRRYIFQYNQDDLDEALRWAMDRLTEIHPDTAITTETLSSAGREIDVSAISSILDVTRVWTPYTSSSPEYPPNWKNFEYWAPSQILFIDSGSEPASSDVVRLWFTRPQTLNGLDSASTTSLAENLENLIVVGASGFVAQERVQEEDRRAIPRKLREWADARLREFERGLKALARRQGTGDSGVAPMARLDRHDRGDGEW